MANRLTQQQIEVLLSVMGIGLFYLIALVERFACPWYAVPADRHE
jgi:hypothetical protein